MRLIRSPGPRATLAALLGAAALVAASVTPAWAARPPPQNVPALSGFVTDACSGLPIAAGLAVGLAPIDPVAGQPGPLQSPAAQGLGFFTYPTRDPGPVQLTVSAPGYLPLGADPTGAASPGVTITKDPGPVQLPAGQALSFGLVLDIRLVPTGQPGPIGCKPPNPNLPAIMGRGVDAATGLGLRGLMVGLAPIDPAGKDPGPIQLPSAGPLLGVFSFRDPGPVGFGFQFYAAAPGHTSLGAKVTANPGPSQFGPGIELTVNPGPINLPAGTGSVNVSLVLGVALPAGPAGG